MISLDVAWEMVTTKVEGGGGNNEDVYLQRQ